MNACFYFAAPPQPPTLTGPTDVKSGTPYTWTCTSVGAFPEQTMNLRLGNTPISNGVSTNSVFDQGSKLYTVTSTLSWTPSSNNAGNTLFCDVFHPETLGQTPQTANLPLNIQCKLALRHFTSISDFACCCASLILLVLVFYILFNYMAQNN